MVNKMYLSLDRLEMDVYKCIEHGNVNSALKLIIDFVTVVINDPIATAQVFGSERLDRLCLAIGGSVTKGRALNEVEQSTRSVVTIATSLEMYGGHTLVVADMIRAQPDSNHILLLTDLFGRVDTAALNKRFGKMADLRIAPQGDEVDKLLWLLDQLDTISPTRILLFNHHQDAVAISALEPFLGVCPTFFYHHADHHLSLGLHLPHAIHIDPHNLGFHNCQSHEGLTENVYLPLVVEDQGVRAPDLGFMKDGVLRTCSAGSQSKYSQAYPYSYAELIAKRLSLVAGVHIHIGDIPDEMQEKIDTELLSYDINPQRFIHIPWVESLWFSLIENEVDLYISSFPYGGGRAAIEVMGAGIPLLMHASDSSRFNGGVDIAYEGALAWGCTDDFIMVLEGLTSSVLNKQSADARTHYESHHVPPLLQQELAKVLLGGDGRQPPPLTFYRPDAVQKYLNLSAAMRPQLDDYALHLDNLEKVLASRDGQIEELLAGIQTKDNYIEELVVGVQAKDNYIEELVVGVQYRDSQIHDIDQQLHERNLQLQDFYDQLQDKSQLAASQSTKLMHKEKELENKNEKIEKLSRLISALEGSIRLIEGSFSWRLTKPIRWLKAVWLPNLNKE